MDLGRDPTAAFFFQGWLLSVRLTSGALSDLVLINIFITTHIIYTLIILLFTIFIAIVITLQEHWPETELVWLTWIYLSTLEIYNYLSVKIIFVIN